MKVLSHFKLRTKLMLLVGLAILAVIVTIAAAASLMERRMFADRVDKLRAVVQSAVSIAQSLENRVVAHQLTREQAFALLRDDIHAIRFDRGDGYVAVQTLDNIMVFHGTAQALEGKPSPMKNADGKLVADVLNDASPKADEGTITYMLPKQGQTEPREKVAYLARFAPWDQVFEAAAFVDDINDAFDAVLLRLSLIGGGIVAITLLAAWLIERDISVSLGALKVVMERLAKGDLTTAVGGVDRRDEAGSMAVTVQVFKDSMVTAERLRGEHEKIKLQAAADQKAALNRLADGFESQVGRLIGMLSSSSTELEATAQSMTGTAGRSNEQAAAVAAAAEQASAGMQTIASAAEELTASIGEIGRQVAQSARITTKAVDDAKRTDAIVHALAEGAEKIGNVVRSDHQHCQPNQSPGTQCHH